MSNDEIWKSIKPQDSSGASPKESAESRFCDIKEMEQREIYESHYQRIYPLLTAGKLDFTQVAKQTGLKERKIRDTLLSRLANDDLIQLFGHKEGICYVCAARMRSNFTKEPLCIACIEAIGEAILELYPTEQATTSESTPPPITIHDRTEALNAASHNSRQAPSHEAQNAMKPEGPIPDMVPKAQFDAVVRELQQYREKYGPLFDDNVHLDEAINEIDTPITDYSINDSMSEESAIEQEQPEQAGQLESIADQTIWDILETNDTPEEFNYVTISPNALPKTSDPTAPTEPIRHFGFQRLRIRT